MQSRIAMHSMHKRDLVPSWHCQCKCRCYQYLYSFYHKVPSTPWSAFQNFIFPFTGLRRAVQGGQRRAFLPEYESPKTIRFLIAATRGTNNRAPMSIMKRKASNWRRHFPIFDKFNRRRRLKNRDRLKAGMELRRFNHCSSPPRHCLRLSWEAIGLC